MIDAGIAALILSDPNTSDLAGGRVWPLLNEANPTTGNPTITYQLISTVDDYTLDGPLGLVKVRFQLDCWGATYGDAKHLAAATKMLLDGFEGTLPNGVAVSDIHRDGEHTGFDSVARCYYVQTDWMIWYCE